MNYLPLSEIKYIGAGTKASKLNLALVKMDLIFSVDFQNKWRIIH